MKIRVLGILVLGFILALLISVGASCGDDDDDDSGDDDDDADDDNIEPTGVCHYECTYFTNTTIRQTMCYDTSGTGSMALVGFANEADCQEYAQGHCDEMNDGDADLTNIYFTMDCSDCDDLACEPEWLEDYT
jgi:hypothetical protein